MTQPTARQNEAVVRWAVGPRSADFKHLALHVAKVAGIASGLAEKMDHHDEPADAWRDFDERRLPDLVILAAMIAELRGVDLSAAIERRGKELVNRV